MGERVCAVCVCLGEENCGVTARLLLRRYQHDPRHQPSSTNKGLRRNIEICFVNVDNLYSNSPISPNPILLLR